MAQERNEINPFDSRSARQAREPLAQGAAQGSNETAEIKSEIERTRVEMSETLGEIQERLRPEHLIQQAKDSVTEAASGKVRNIMHSAGETATMVADQTKYAGRSVADYVRNHPVQVALLAGGVTWWLLRGRDRSDDWEGASEGWQDGQGYSEGYSIDEGRPLTAKVGEYASAARETVGEYASSARETAGEYAASASATARSAGRRVANAASTATVKTRQGLRRASTSVDDWVHEYPLAAGAIAVAVGAAIGLSAPSTDWEDRTLGEKRDQAMERARIAARDIKQNVTQKVQDVADSVIDVANAAKTSTTSQTTTTTASPSTTGSV